MPIYEYRCLACGHQFEQLVRGASQPSCPTCQAREVERLLSSFGVASEARSHATLQAARRDFTFSRNRQEQLRHERDEVLSHVQEDYGLRVPKGDD
jgi:putative FmdB family regulatory protein